MRNYQNYFFDSNLSINIHPYFLNKYHLLPYSKITNMVVVITDIDNIFIEKKLSNILNIKVIVCKVTTDELMRFKRLKDLNIENQNILSKVEENFKILDSNVNIINDKEIVSPVVNIINNTLEEAYLSNTSDIHIEPCKNNIVIKFRIDGELIVKNTISISLKEDLAVRLKVMSNLDITKKFFPQDGKFIFKTTNFSFNVRISFIPGIYGEIIVLRILYQDKKLTNLEDLLLPEEEYQRVLNIINKPCGLVLVVGPTGVGKSTTLQTLLLKNKEQNHNIITIEDPVEYTIDGINQVQINQEMGITFSTILRSVLRQDPNIIMVGEIRDETTAELSIQASLTGHLVYSTLHTTSSFGVITRLIDLGIKKDTLIEGLSGIISQRLLRKLCNNCKRKVEGENNIVYYEKVGCPMCNMTGYIGRIGLYEIIEITEELKEELGNVSNTYKFNNVLEKHHIQTLKKYGENLLKEGVISLEELNKI